MKKVYLMALLLAFLPAIGQDQPSPGLDDLLQSAQDFASENLDTNVLQTLAEPDQAKIEDFLAQIQQKLRGDYVLDLAALENTAKIVLPILEEHQATQPYAIWLKSRLDYLEAAAEWRRSAPSPQPAPGKLPAPFPNPKPGLVRSIWVKRLSQRPPPRGAPPLAAALKPIFRQEQTPGELVWLAEVESSFNSRARSPAGASGLFQLMPATAKRFGLRTWPWDHRLDARESAHAAAKYLHTLQTRFRDWRLALAAYNAGEGLVQKLLNRHTTKSFDAIATQLPAETQMYVPKVEAVLLRREGIKLQDLRTETGP